ncbi:hypothetical protein SIO70_19465 [Chitinophaga sancti]|uniref:hypothetical protein n=1 Tax=Chitinophaga sancti TaxID=1004 RepID=UPI002A74744B|nr:hypothetical protein [Chitinophaga sancti]WPQ60531.1 hypothetical protein SIO70_19465 [Chitinophaga sancti]
MAIFLEGKSKCPICGKVIIAAEAYLFPPFVSNRKEPLDFFNDKVFHKSCLLTHPLAEKAIQFTKVPMPFVCKLTEEPIWPGEEIFGFGLVTSDENSPAYALNFAYIKKEAFYKWEQRDAVLAELKRLEINL